MVCFQMGRPRMINPAYVTQPLFPLVAFLIPTIQTMRHQNAQGSGGHRRHTKLSVHLFEQPPLRVLMPDSGSRVKFKWIEGTLHLH